MLRTVSLDRNMVTSKLYETEDDRKVHPKRRHNYKAKSEIRDGERVYFRNTNIKFKPANALV